MAIQIDVTEGTSNERLMGIHIRRLRRIQVMQELSSGFAFEAKRHLCWVLNVKLLHSPCCSVKNELALISQISSSEDTNIPSNSKLLGQAPMHGHVTLKSGVTLNVQSPVIPISFASINLQVANGTGTGPDISATVVNQQRGSGIPGFVSTSTEITTGPTATNRHASAPAP